mmetsp:Transcript_22887/g.50849  ORF Transcript_22887/g.50849 Transcript_22887/m.50849 type:complete len:687 (+) Transcript_22887:230-2290(+)
MRGRGRNNNKMALVLVPLHTPAKGCRPTLSKTNNERTDCCERNAAWCASGNAKTKTGSSSSSGKSRSCLPRSGEHCTTTAADLCVLEGKVSAGDRPAVLRGRNCLEHRDKNCLEHSYSCYRVEGNHGPTPRRTPSRSHRRRRGERESSGAPPAPIPDPPPKKTRAFCVCAGTVSGITATRAEPRSLTPPSRPVPVTHQRAFGRIGSCTSYGPCWLFVARRIAASCWWLRCVALRRTEAPIGFATDAAQDRVHHRLLEVLESTQHFSVVSQGLLVETPRGLLGDQFFQLVGEAGGRFVAPFVVLAAFALGRGGLGLGHRTGELLDHQEGRVFPGERTGTGGQQPVPLFLHGPVQGAHRAGGDHAGLQVGLRVQGDAAPRRTKQAREEGPGVGLCAATAAVTAIASAAQQRNAPVLGDRREADHLRHPGRGQLRIPHQVFQFGRGHERNEHVPFGIEFQALQDGTRLLREDRQKDQVGPVENLLVVVPRDRNTKGPVAFLGQFLGEGSRPRFGPPRQQDRFDAESVVAAFDRGPGESPGDARGDHPAAQKADPEARAPGLFRRRRGFHGGIVRCSCRLSRCFPGRRRRRRRGCGAEAIGGIRGGPQRNQHQEFQQQPRREKTSSTASSSRTLSARQQHAGREGRTSCWESRAIRPSLHDGFVPEKKQHTRDRPNERTNERTNESKRKR